MNRILIIAGMLFFFGCRHETVIIPEPVIVINTPENNQHYVKGDTIHITGTITHSVELLEVGVHMTDLSTQTEFFHNHFSAGNATTYQFNSQYPIPDDAKYSLEVEIEATDKYGNTATKERLITIN
jgi:Domain of unknown function (DUF4625)